jgi:ribose 5-phosphate isomerase A
MTDFLAVAAVEPIVSGMTVGLGTGRAATRGIRALAERARAERLELLCVATSEASTRLAASLGLRVEPLQSVGRVDYLFDGADEVDPLLRMIKGRGGAMTREKKVAHASARRVYLIQSDKLALRLGEKALLPVEPSADHLATVREALQALGLRGQDRVAADGRPYRTDGGNPVLDVKLPLEVDVSSLARALDSMPGVVGHGLFLSEADLVLIENEAGELTRRTRQTG